MTAARKKLRSPQDGFLYMPAKMIHEAWTGDGDTTYFITVDGKWDANFVE